MASANSHLPLLLSLLLLLYLLKGAKPLPENRTRRQFGGGFNPAFDSASSELKPLSGNTDEQECREEPEISHARVRCTYSGCRVMCDAGYRTSLGIGFATLTCDHSSGTLTIDGAYWRDHDLACLPQCGERGCQHGGTCVRPETCECLAGFSGKNCEVVPKDTASLVVPVVPENQTQTVAPTEPQPDPDACPKPDFPVHNATVTRVGANLIVQCADGHFLKTGLNADLIPCRNGTWHPPARLLAPDGGLACEESRCVPPCLNGGVCLPEGVCDCPYRFWGGYCQIQRCGLPNPATIGPASLGGVLASRMKIQCHPLHRMLSGRRIQTILCRGGEWHLPGGDKLRDSDVRCYPEDSMPVTAPA